MRFPRLDDAPHSPFTGEERDTIEAIIEAIARSGSARTERVLEIVEAHLRRLEAFGELMSQFPSPIDHDRLGERERSLASLTDVLCHSNPANFEFRAPTRAIVGRALDMAESNFYRLLARVCSEVLEEPVRGSLRQQAIDRLREVIYTKIVEEVLGDIVSDSTLDSLVRERAVYSLCQIWDTRLTYRTRQFFPLLRAAWEARQHMRVHGGTLLGTDEMFALFREGCDPQFVEFFTRPEPDEDEVEAFREFLFGRTSEQLASLYDEMERNGCSTVSLAGVPGGPSDDEGTRLYEFFRARFMQAAARRLANRPGPKRTAEGYVMIDYLSARAREPFQSIADE
jgi:hypothetical protein